MKKIISSIGIISYLVFMLVFPNSAFSQDVINKNDSKQILSSFSSKNNNTKMEIQSPIFSFFFKAYGGFIILDHNLFYDSETELLEQITSLNGDFDNPTVTTINFPEEEMSDLKQLISDSNFFESDTDYTNSSSNFGKMLTITMDDKSHTMFWRNTTALPNDLNALALLFDSTCEKYC